MENILKDVVVSQAIEITELRAELKQSQSDREMYRNWWTEAQALLETNKKEKE